MLPAASKTCAALVCCTAVEGASPAGLTWAGLAHQYAVDLQLRPLLLAEHLCAQVDGLHEPHIVLAQQRVRAVLRVREGSLDGSKEVIAAQES